MEYAGFKNCFESMFGNNLNLGTFVSDRHNQIIKHMKEELTELTHFFDLWHLKKSKLFRNVLLNFDQDVYGNFYSSVFEVGRG